MARTVPVFAAACLAVTACQPGAAPTPPPVEEGMIYLGEDMNGAQVTLKTGDMIRIELESIPTAGYVWEIEDQPDFLELVEESTRPTDPEFQNQPGVTGGHHFMAFDLKATAPGTATIHMIDHRPWEDGDARGKWQVDVTVDPAP